MNAAAVDAAGLEMLNMLHTLSTNVQATMNAKLEAHKLCTRDPIIGPGRHKHHEAWARENGYRNNQQASKQASTVDQRARSTDKQAKPSSNRQASMDPGTSFKHP